MAVTAGQLVPVCFKWEGNTTLTGITDTAGNTYALLTGQQHGSLEPSVRMGYVLSATAHAANVITGTFSGTSPYRRGGAMAFTYNGSMSTDGEVGSTDANSSLTPSSNTLTTAGTDGVMIGCHGDYTTQAFSAETIASLSRDGRITQTDFDMFYEIPTAGHVNATTSVTRTVPQRWVQRFAAFKTAGGGAAPPPPTAGVVYYVALTGTNTTCAAASTITTPARTFAFAVACLAPGDTLYIRAGTWTEQLNLGTLAGTPGNYKTIAGYPSERPCLTAKSGPVGSAVYTYGTINYVVLRNLKIDGLCDGTTIANLAAQYGMTISNQGTPPHHLLIDNVEISNWRYNGILIGGGANNITIQNSQIHDMQTVYNGSACSDPPNAATSQGRWYGLYIHDTTNVLIQNTEIYRNPGGGIQAYPGPNAGLVITNNYVHDNNMCNPNGGFGGILLQGSNTSPIIARNLIVNNGSDFRSGAATGIMVNGTTTGAQLYNNTVYGNGGSNGGYGIELGNNGSAPTGTIITNNHVVGNVTGQIHSTAGSSTQTTNRTTVTITDCTVSTSNFVHKAGSSCLNAGTAISGFPFNGAAPDQGRYETFTYSTASINGNSLDVTLGENLPANTPMVAVLTGWAVNNGRTVTAASLLAGTSSVIRLTVSGAACANGETWTVTATSASVTDAFGQPVVAFSAQPVTNLCSGSTPPTSVLSQVTHQFFSAFYLPNTTTKIPLSAVGATTTTLHAGIPFMLETQTDCTVADCAPIAEQLYYRITPLATGTPSAYAPVPDVMGTNQVAWYGTTSDPTVLNGPVTCCLSGALTPTNGDIGETSAATPVFDLPLNGSVVQGHVLQLGPFAVLGDIYEFKEYNQNGTALDGYTPSGGAKLTVTPVAGNSAPTGLHTVGASSNTLVELVWAPVTDANFASYKVYQASTSGGPYTQAGPPITAVSAAATHSPMTIWRTVLPVTGTYYFVVSWVDTGGQESPMSNEVAVTRTGFVPRPLRTP
jgi:hypothetical protein